MKLSRKKQFLIVLIAFLVLGIPFKVMVLIEGFTEVRPVNAIPPLAGLICGPVGAVACGLGNLLTDLFGTFNETSILGLFSNMLAAYVPYRLWHIYSSETPNVHKNINILKYIFISFAAALTVAWTLGFGLFYVFGQWIENIYTYIFFNNFGFSVALGLPVFIILTTDEINIQCVVKPKKYILLKNEKLRYIVPIIYTVLMTVMLAGVCGLHLSPADYPLFHLISAAGTVGLILILI